MLGWVCWLMASALPGATPSAYDPPLVITVVDETGQPLPGVQVFTTGQSFSDISDERGQVRLVNLSPDDLVTFRFLGYRPRTIPYLQLKQGPNARIKLRPETKQLREVVVVGRRNDAPRELPFVTELVSQNQLQSTVASTSAEAIEEHGQAYVQRSQLGGGSPVLRGFEANRVLLVVDGVRMNNAIYRSGHLQNSITVDAGMLDRLEIIYGPGSLHYGSDALGGVVHFRTRHPEVDAQQPVSLGANLQYGTAARSTNAHTHVQLSGERWASLTSLSFSDFGDLRTGKRFPNAYPNAWLDTLNVIREDGKDLLVPDPNPYTQGPSGYRQYDLDQKIRYRPNARLDLVGNFQLSTSSDVPRYDRLSELDNGGLRFAEWSYGPQTRMLSSVRARIGSDNRLFNRATIIGSWQFIEEDRMLRNFGAAEREHSLVDVRVWSLTADFDKLLDVMGTHRLRYGLEYRHNQVGSEAFLEDISTGSTSTAVEPRYPAGGSQLQAAGAYLDYRWRMLDTMIYVHAGTRLSRTRLQTAFANDRLIDWPPNFTEGIENTNTALTGALGITVRPGNDWRFRLLAATAFRAPNVDDWVKFREKNSFITIPNPALRPERSRNMELTVGRTFGNARRRKGTLVNIGLTGFYTQLRDVMTRQDFQLPDGSQSFVSRGDTLMVQANVNAERANIYGFSLVSKARFGENWRAEASINQTWGRRSLVVQDTFYEVTLDTMVPQDHIPPLYGRLSLRYQQEQWSVQAVWRFNGAKRPEDYAVAGATYNPRREAFDLDQSGTADNIEYGLQQTSTDPDQGTRWGGTYAWSTFNLYGQYRFNQNWSIQLGLENILDLHYRHFASGISAPGRNVTLAVRYGG
ncbi:MAG: TonB-dependent receptor [Bacteroidota bacterium]